MLTTDKEVLASAVLHIQELLDTSILIEDPVSGAIQLNTDMYTHLGKNAPASTGMNHQRAKALAVVYQKLWPSGITSGGRPVRQGPLALTKKLTVYLNKHPKTTEQEILSAAERYLGTKKKENYSFITCSDYFIEKGGSSLLEAYITNPELGSKNLEPSQSINQRFV